jgi:hypothetical protein
MNKFEAMCREHFNEPVLTHLKIGRVIGYGEDDRDCYVIIAYPNERTIWHTCVGGYTFLNLLKEQGVVAAHNGERWDDLWRIDGDLTRAGCPKVDEFILNIRVQPGEPGTDRPFEDLNDDEREALKAVEER